MVEKQASSEIAQSREGIQKLCPAYRQAGTVAAHWCVICQALEQAERDTRERCRQELTEIQPIPELIPGDLNEGHTYKVGFFDALRAGAERIRGKE